MKEFLQKNGVLVIVGVAAVAALLWLTGTLEGCNTPQEEVAQNTPAATTTTNVTTAPTGTKNAVPENVAPPTTTVTAVPTVNTEGATNTQQ